MLTGLEWVVVVFAILGLLKLAVIVVDRSRWLPVIHEVYDNSGTFSWIFLILAIIVFRVLIQELTIVQIVAVMAFTTLVAGLALLHYSKDVVQLAKKLVTSKIDGWLFLYIIVWVALLVWALWAIFFP